MSKSPKILNHQISSVFSKTIEEEKKHLLKLQRRAVSTLSKSPVNGDLETHVSKKKNYYYIRTTDSNGKPVKKYINSSDRDTIEKYIKKYCTKRLKAETEKALDIIETKPLYYDFDCIQNLYIELEEKFGELTPDIFKSRNTLLDEWRDQPYEKNPYPLDPVNQYKTDRGETVRSKMEALGCNIVNRLGLRYHVDELITLPSGKKLAPDMIIISPKDRELILVEFMGLMSDDEYVKKKLRDIHEYVKAGFVPGDNLLLFTEYEDSKFDTVAFENVLRKKFLE